MIEKTSVQELGYALYKAFFDALQSLEGERIALGVPAIKIIREGVAYTFEGGKYANTIVIQRAQIEGEDWQYHAHSSKVDLSNLTEQPTHRLRLSRVSFAIHLIAGSNKAEAFLEKVQRLALPANGFVGDGSIPFYEYNSQDESLTEKGSIVFTLENAISFSFEKEMSERVLQIVFEDALLYEIPTNGIYLIAEIIKNLNLNSNE